jgi:glycine/D-amino acid oxidase-like deaminating enzyme
MNADVVVVGGGTVGAATAYGLTGSNLHVILLDGGDRDFRSATANFGLVWAQGKGVNMPAYQDLTLGAVDLWPDFSLELEELTGIDVQLERNGGLALCMGEAQFEARRNTLAELDRQLGRNDRSWEMLDRITLEKLLPKVGLGPDVYGASFGHHDGCANPLRLLTALYRGIVRRGGEVRRGRSVDMIRPYAQGGGFSIYLNGETINAAQVVIAAGLGSKPLAAALGMDVPIHPNRGQLLVTERVEPFLSLPISGLRQTREGTVMIGVTHEDAGFDTSTTSGAAATMSAEAIRRIPGLGRLTLVRQWAGLRIMSPDGCPIYAESERYPGAFVALCHSGITLASTHARIVAEGIAQGRLPSSLDVFHQRRFNVQEAA